MTDDVNEDGDDGVAGVLDALEDVEDQSVRRQRYTDRLEDVDNVKGRNAVRAVMKWLRDDIDETDKDEAELVKAAVRAFAWIDNNCNDAGRHDVVPRLGEIAEDISRHETKTGLKEFFDEQTSAVAAQSGDTFVAWLESELVELTKIIYQDSTTDMELKWDFGSYEFRTSGQDKKSWAVVREMAMRHEGEYPPDELGTDDWSAYVDDLLDDATINRVPGPLTAAIKALDGRIGAATEFEELEDACDRQGCWTRTVTWTDDLGNDHEGREIVVPNEWAKQAAEESDVPLGELAKEIIVKSLHSPDPSRQQARWWTRVDGKNEGLWVLNAEKWTDPDEYVVDPEDERDRLRETTGTSLPGSSAVADGDTGGDD